MKILAAACVLGAACAEAAPPVEAFAQLPGMTDPELSPDGAYIAYFSPLNGRRHAVVQKLFSGEQPNVIPPYEELEFSWLRWANDERLVFAMSYSDRRQFTETTETRLLSADRTGRDIVALIKRAKRKKTGSRTNTVELPMAQTQDNVIDWLPDDPQHVLVALDEDQDARWEVRRIDVRSGDYDIVTDGTRGVQNWLTDRSHEVRVGYGYDRSDYTIMVRPPDGGWGRAERKEWWNDGWMPIGFTDDPAMAYAHGPGESGLNVLRLLDLNKGDLGDTVWAHDEVDVAGLLHDAVTGALVGVSYVDDLPRRHYFDPELARMQASLDKVFPKTVNHMLSWSRNRQQVLVRTLSDVEPGSVYYWDRDRQSIELIAESMPGLGPDVLSPVRAVRYAARDGVSIPAYLTVPRDTPAESLPVVVLPHGGPAARDDRSFWFLSQFLASRGYVVFQPNFRGSSGYGKAFEYAGVRQWGGLMQDDVTDGAHWLVAEGIADPDRMCVVGWSYGGYAAAMGAVKTPNLYRCAASINGVLNLPRLIADDKSYVGGRSWTKHMGLDDENAKAVSPYHRAEEIVVPMLIVQAMDDTRVHADQGEGMAKRLRRLDKPVDYVEVEFGGHSMTNEAARLAILTALEDFLDRYLAGP